MNGELGHQVQLYSLNCGPPKHQLSGLVIPKGQGKLGAWEHEVDYDTPRTRRGGEETAGRAVKEDGLLETRYQGVLAAAAQEAEGAERAKAKKRQAKQQQRPRGGKR